MTSTDHSLAARVQRLEDLQALQALKARYAAAADAKYTPQGQRQSSALLERAAAEQAACFHADAVWEGGSFGGHIVGRDALFTWFCRSPWRFAAHFYQSPRFTLEGDSASAEWRLWQLGIRADDDRTMLIVGNTFERYRRDAGGWLIEAMRFDSLHTLGLPDAAGALRCVIPGAQVSA
jgi:hypothetical protein